MLDAIDWVVEPLLLSLLLVVAGFWAVAIVLTWLPTFRSWCFRVGFFGPGREQVKQLARYDRVCRRCAYPIDGEDRCPECGTSTRERNTIRPAELSTWAWRYPSPWLRRATVIALLASLSFFGGREALKLGNRMQWGSARPFRTSLRMVHAPVMSWAYARTVDLPIGPDYRVHYDSTFITDPDFSVTPEAVRPRQGEVICWIGPAPAPQQSGGLTSFAGVEPEQYPAMERSSHPYQDARAYAPDAVAVRIDLPSEAWSTIGNGHPNKQGVGGASALEALYEHAGLLNAWHGSAPELAAMADRLDLHLRGGHLRMIMSGEMPREDFGVSCVGYTKSRTAIPVLRQPVGLVLFGLVQVVVIAVVIGYVKVRSWSTNHPS